MVQKHKGTKTNIKTNTKKKLQRCLEMTQYIK